MNGSTIVYIPDLQLGDSDLYDRIMEDEEFEKIELHELTTLEFSFINEEAETKWGRGSNPIVYDEENGIVIIHISESGLESVLTYEGELEDIDAETQNDDISALSKFVDKHGVEHLYELMTF